MSESLKDLSIKHLQHLTELLKLIEVDSYREISKDLEQTEIASLTGEAYEIYYSILTINDEDLEQTIGTYDQDLEIHFLILKSIKELCLKDPDNELFQSIFHINLDAIHALGKFFEYRRLFIQAKKCYELHLSISQSILKAGLENVIYPTNIGETLYDLGILFLEMGRFQEAQKTLEKSLEIKDKFLSEDLEPVTYQLDVGNARYRFGSLLANMGKYEDAMNALEMSHEISKNLLKKDPENVDYQSRLSSTFNILGELFFNMGQYKEAKQMLEKSLEIKEKLLHIDPENVYHQENIAKTLNDLGLLFGATTGLEEAKQMIEKSFEIRKRLLQKDPENENYQSNLAETLDSIGLLISYKGYFEEAKKWFEKSLEIKERLLQKDQENEHHKLAVFRTYDLLSRLFYKMKYYSDALDFQLQGLKNYDIQSANLDLLFRSYGLIGRCYEKLGHYDCAFIKYKESIECIESVRSQYSNEELKIDTMWNKSDLYSEMISLLCSKKMNEPEKAWEYLGRFKSRTLLDIIKYLELEAPKSVPSKFIIEEKKLIESILSFDRIIRKVTKAKKRDQLVRRIKESESKLDEIYNQIRDFSPEYVDLRRGQPLGISEIKELIGGQNKKVAFIEYYINSEKVFIFVMRSDKKNVEIGIEDLSSYELQDYLVRYYMEIIETPDTSETWQKLSKKLIEPIFGYIDGCELVYIIPCGLLHYLPFHAFFVKEKGSSEKKRLIEYFPIVYLPNLSILKYIQRRNSRCLKPCISLGYTPYDYQKELFEGEAESVAKQFYVKPILGEQAKSDVLKNVSSDVIHVSCHGIFDQKEPLNSGLCLKDGILTARKIFDMSIKTNLLVLSACETGLNDQKPGDDFIGLTRAFLYAGARSLVVSLWSVEAKSTFIYMNELYNKLDSGIDKAKAVQKVQIDFINKKYGQAYSHPYFWAPFTLIGDWK
jgi:CHAT domain-containing protein